ncbi:MAG: LCP family protein [Ilumatobacteraceae bacterium]
MADPSESTPTDPPDPDLPTTSKRRRSARHTAAQRTILVLNIVVVLACFVGAGTLLMAKRVREDFVAAPRPTYADAATPPGAATTSTAAGSDGTDPAPTEAATTTPETFPSPDPQAMNFLITGSDNKACADPDSPWAAAAENREGLGSRADTIMVLRLDPVTNAAAVLSFPRDLWVEIPGKSSQRINTTFQQGEFDLMAQTLYADFGVKIDHFVQIDFCAFKKIVDAVGGVSVPLPSPVRDLKYTGLNIPDAGCHEFSGDEALAYVRSRHLQYQDADGTWKTDETSDYGRIARQQDFLRRMLQTASSRGLLLNPGLIRDVITAVQDYVVFDEGFSIDDMLKFASLLRNIPPASIHTYQVQGKGTTIGGNAVILPQIDGENMTAILDIFRGVAPLAGAPEQVDDTTTSNATTSAPSTLATTTTGVSSGPVGPTTSTSSASTTTTVAETTTPVTNPEDIIRGIVPDKNAVC